MLDLLHKINVWITITHETLCTWTAIIVGILILVLIIRDINKKNKKEREKYFTEIKPKYPDVKRNVDIWEGDPLWLLYIHEKLDMIEKFKYVAITVYQGDSRCITVIGGNTIEEMMEEPHYSNIVAVIEDKKTIKFKPINIKTIEQIP